VKCPAVLVIPGCVTVADGPVEFVARGLGRPDVAVAGAAHRRCQRGVFEEFTHEVDLGELIRRQLGNGEPDIRRVLDESLTN